MWSTKIRCKVKILIWIWEKSTLSEGLRFGLFCYNDYEKDWEPIWDVDKNCPKTCILGSESQSQKSGK